MKGKPHPNNRGTAKGEPAARKTTRSVPKAKSSRRRRMRKNWDEDHIEQEESQQTEKGERNRKGQPKLQQVEKVQRKNGNNQP